MPWIFFSLKSPDEWATRLTKQACRDETVVVFLSPISTYAPLYFIVSSTLRRFLRPDNFLYIYIYIYTHIYNRIEQCALQVTTIMALWQLVNLGTRCTVTHCRIALWSHQSAQTASSERCINANSERLSERLSTQSIRVLNRIYLEHDIQ